MVVNFANRLFRILAMHRCIATYSEYTTTPWFFKLLNRKVPVFWTGLGFFYPSTFETARPRDGWTGLWLTPWCHYTWWYRRSGISGVYLWEIQCYDLLVGLKLRWPTILAKVVWTLVFDYSTFQILYTCKFLSLPHLSLLRMPPANYINIVVSLQHCSKGAGSVNSVPTLMTKIVGLTIGGYFHCNDGSISLDDSTNEDLFTKVRKFNALTF